MFGIDGVLNMLEDGIKCVTLERIQTYNLLQSLLLHLISLFFSCLLIFSLLTLLIDLCLNAV